MRSFAVILVVAATVGLAASAQPRFKSTLRGTLSVGGKDVKVPTAQDAFTLGLEYEVKGSLLGAGNTELKGAFAESKKKLINGIPLLLMDPDTLTPNGKKVPFRKVELITGPVTLSKNVQTWWKANTPEGGKWDFKAAAKAAVELPNGSPEEKVEKKAAQEWVQLVGTLEVLIQAWSGTFAVAAPSADGNKFDAAEAVEVTNIPHTQTGTPESATGVLPGMITAQEFVDVFNHLVKEIKEAATGDPAKALIDEIQMKTDNPTALASSDNTHNYPFGGTSEGAQLTTVTKLHTGEPGNTDWQPAFAAKKGLCAAKHFSFDPPHANFLSTVKSIFTEKANKGHSVKAPFAEYYATQATLNSELQAAPDTADAEAVFYYFFKWITHYSKNAQKIDGRALNPYKNTWEHLLKAPVGDLVRALSPESRAAIYKWYHAKDKAAHCAEINAKFGITPVKVVKKKGDASSAVEVKPCEHYIDATFKAQGHPRYKKDTTGGSGAYSDTITKGVNGAGEDCNHDNADATLPVSNKDPVPPMVVQGHLCILSEQRGGVVGGPHFGTLNNPDKNDALLILDGSQLRVAELAGLGYSRTQRKDISDLMDRVPEEAGWAPAEEPPKFCLCQTKPPPPTSDDPTWEPKYWDPNADKEIAGWKARQVCAFAGAKGLEGNNRANCGQWGGELKEKKDLPKWHAANAAPVQMGMRGKGGPPPMGKKGMPSAPPVQKTKPKVVEKHFAACLACCKKEKKKGGAWPKSGAICNQNKPCLTELGEPDYETNMRQWEKPKAEGGNDTNVCLAWEPDELNVA